MTKKFLVILLGYKESVRITRKKLATNRFNPLTPRVLFLRRVTKTARKRFPISKEEGKYIPYFTRQNPR